MEHSKQRGRTVGLYSSQLLSVRVSVHHVRNWGSQNKFWWNLVV